MPFCSFLVFGTHYCMIIITVNHVFIFCYTTCTKHGINKSHVNSIQILHGLRGSSENYFSRGTGSGLPPRTRRVRGGRPVASTEGKIVSLLPRNNHVVFVLLHLIHIYEMMEPIYY